jgi:ABC-type Zn uptake system ZnuABC Zn-binding protein ZnuA
MQLDAWIREPVAQIPAENRQMITDHPLLGYFVDEYGIDQDGAIIPGYSSMAEPSAQELAQIEDAIVALGVPAIFVGNSVNPALAERVASDTGVQLVFFYTGSLSEAGGEAETYLDYMRYNTNAIVEALK